MRLFCDASALAKRYVEETGSAELETLLESASALGLSVITVTEVISALCRRQREGTLSDVQYAVAKAALLADVADADTVNVSEQVVSLAVDMLERHSLRSADALQLAGAQAWRAEMVVTSDRKQCAAARSSGRQVRLLG